MTFQERKAIRTEYFFRVLYKKKLVICTACNGSGWYDSCDENGNSIPCGSCDGQGKVRES